MQRRRAVGRRCGVSSTHQKPWRAIAKYDGPQHDPKYWVVIDDQERVIVDTLNADSRWNADEQEVFVRMIVSAVNSHADLLAACEQALNIITLTDDAPNTVAQIKTALAKARGTT